jgi:hypothetical protein
MGAVTLLDPTKFKSTGEWLEWCARISHGAQEKTGEDTPGFIDRVITKAGHTAVCEHAPFRVHVDEDERSLIDWLVDDPTLPFVWKMPGGMVLAPNLRHVGQRHDRMSGYQIAVAASVLDKAPILKPKYMPSATLRVVPGHQIPTPDENLICDPTDWEKVTFASFLFSGISRVTETQSVRHRTLSYIVQSNRHVEPLKFVMPPSVRKDWFSRLLFRGLTWAELVAYRLLRWRGVPKGDARYLVGQGVCTQEIVTGSIWWWKAFLRERLAPAAQWEIRMLAGEIEALLRGAGLWERL